MKKLSELSLTDILMVLTPQLYINSEKIFKESTFVTSKENVFILHFNPSYDFYAHLKRYYERD